MLIARIKINKSLVNKHNINVEMSVCKSVPSHSLWQQVQTLSKSTRDKDLLLKGWVKVIGKVALYSLWFSPVSAE